MIHKETFSIVAAVVTLGGAAVVVAACSDDADPVARRGANGTSGGGGGNNSADGGGTPINTGAGSGPPPDPSLQIRVASLDDGLAPFDFCVGAATIPDDGGPAVAAAYVGPVMKGLGVAAGIAPGNVSQRSKYAPGAYVIRFVGADAPNCDAVGDPAQNEILIPKQPGLIPTVTVVRMPVQNAEEQRPNRILPDDPLAAGQTNVRGFHASPDVEGPIAIRSGGTTIVPVAQFGQLPTGSGFSENGYRPINPLANAPITVDAIDAEQALLNAENVTLAAGVYTLFTLGSVGGGTFRLLVCNDEAAPANSLTPCMSFAPQ